MRLTMDGCNSHTNYQSTHAAISRIIVESFNEAADVCTCPSTKIKGSHAASHAITNLTYLSTAILTVKSAVENNPIIPCLLGLMVRFESNTLKCSNEHNHDSLWRQEKQIYSFYDCVGLLYCLIRK
jgi:hypothetical protein